MLKIAGVRNYLYQWDLNQRVIVIDDDSVNEVHFANEGQTEDAPIVEVKTDEKGRYADIPNILLQSGKNIFAYEYCNVNARHTIRKYKLVVIQRPKPSDYVYTETEVKAYETLRDQINEIDADVKKKLNAPLGVVGEFLAVEEVDENGVATKVKTKKVETAPPDWTENDSTKPGYIKNRPGGYIEKQEITIQVESCKHYLSEDLSIPSIEGDIIDFTIDGVTQQYEVKKNEQSYYIGLNPNAPPMPGSEGGFSLVFDNTHVLLLNATDSTHTYKFNAEKKIKIKKEFMPNEALNIKIQNWDGADGHEVSDDVLEKLKQNPTITLYARKQEAYPTDIAVSPDGKLYLIRDYVAKTKLPTIIFNSLYDENNITIQKSEFHLGEYIVLQMLDSSTKHQTTVTFPPMDLGMYESYPSKDMQTVAYINGRLFAITIVGAVTMSGVSNTTINIKKIL